MLRLLFVLLLAANAWWWAAGQGWLPSGWLPLPDEQAQREPQRLARQLRPQTVTVLPAAKGSAARHCLQSALLADAAQQAAAVAALQAAGIAEPRWQRVQGDGESGESGEGDEGGGGTRLRVSDASGAERDALSAPVGAAAEPLFSACP